MCVPIRTRHRHNKMSCPVKIAMGYYYYYYDNIVLIIAVIIIIVVIKYNRRNGSGVGTYFGVWCVGVVA